MTWESALCGLPEQILGPAVGVGALVDLTSLVNESSSSGSILCIRHTSAMSAPRPGAVPRAKVVDERHTHGIGLRQDVGGEERGEGARADCADSSPEPQNRSASSLIRRFVWQRRLRSASVQIHYSYILKNMFINAWKKAGFLCCFE